MKEVLVLGIGEIGRAIQQLLVAKADIHISMWDRDERKIPESLDIQEAAKKADIVFVCVPSVATREVVRGIAVALRSSATVVSLAKGIEDEGLTMDQVLEEELRVSGAAYGMLGGPMIAEELMKKKRGIGVICGSSPHVHDVMTEVFEHTDLFLEHSSDMRGVVLSGVLKNMYTVLLGIADGLRWGTNRKGWLLSASVGEMAEVIKALGGRKETAFGTAGLGDLSATGFSPFSTNRDMGQHMALGNLDFSSEGKHSVDPIMKLLNGSRYPLLNALQDILSQVASPAERLEAACVQIHQKPYSE